MRKTILIILMLLVCRVGWGAEYIIVIEKGGYVAKGEEAAHNEKGDVIDIQRYKGNMLTECRRGDFICKIVDLSESEKEELLEEEKIDGISVKARKKKIDLSTLPEKEKLTKEELYEKVITKPVSITINK